MALLQGGRHGKEILIINFKYMGSSIDELFDGDKSLVLLRKYGGNMREDVTLEWLEHWFKYFYTEWGNNRLTNDARKISGLFDG